MCSTLCYVPRHTDKYTYVHTYVFVCLYVCRTCERACMRFACVRVVRVCVCALVCDAIVDIESTYVFMYEHFYII